MMRCKRQETIDTKFISTKASEYNKIQQNSAGLVCLTWIAILRAIKSSHVPISNVVGSTYWIVFRSRDAWTISGRCRCSGAE